MRQRPPYFSVAFLSAAALAYEILLMRLFSIIQWHHFAYMMISLALLGYGISGTAIAMMPVGLLKRFPWLYPVCVLLFALTSVVAFAIAQALPFNAEELLWDSRQSLYLLIIFLLLAVPFFFAASAFCLAFMFFREQVARIYAADLVGAGLGCLGIISLLYYVFPLSALVIIAVTGIIAAYIGTWELHLEQSVGLSIACVLGSIVLLQAGRSLQLHMSPYKSLQQTLRVAGTRVIARRSSPLGLLSVVASSEIPLRHAPGLSLQARQEPLPQLGVFTDGDNMIVINRKPQSLQQTAYLDQMTSALPYHLQALQRILIVGAGGGTDILQANYHHTPWIDALEINPQLVDLVDDTYRDFTAGLYLQDNVSLHISEARDFLGRTDQRYDLIQLALLDSFNASSAGLYALNESYLYTVEALQLYLRRLRPGGYLAITRWIKLPPRDTLKLFASVVDALRLSGRQTPVRQIMLIRSWQTSTLLVKNGLFTAGEIKAAKSFCAGRGFDLAWLPGIQESEANHYNLLQQPYFYQGALALLGAQREAFLQQYKFNLQPASDDRPYFNHFFKWRVLPEILRLRGQGGMALLESGYLVFIATLVIAFLLSILLIILPVLLHQRGRNPPSRKIHPVRVVGYFFAIGLAFLFIEIAMMQKFILFLHHPIHAIAVTLTAFLVFAGLGSHYCKWLTWRCSRQRSVMIAVVAILLISGIYLVTLERVFFCFAAVPAAGKMAITLLLIAPLGFFMGMPFPIGLSSVAEHAHRYLPWAWGINGCASVISAVLATLLAIHFGFNTVIVIALLLYLGIMVLFPAPGLNASGRD